MFRKLFHASLLAAAALSAAACTKDELTLSPDGGPVPEDSGPGLPPPAPDGGRPPVGEDGGTPPLQEFPASSKANVRFKRAERLGTDMAAALGLDRGTLCRELGQYSCTDFVHTIALGGVEPYELGIREPLDHTTITTPMAVERLALSGCEQRVTRDLADPAGALIFRDLGIDANGAITDPSGPAVLGALDTLYKRALLRPARESEVAHLTQLYRDLEGTNEPGPARDWAILACFSVMTTMEALFY